jgi:RNA polymerase sigma factor (sigma-70 family)
MSEESPPYLIKMKVQNNRLLKALAHAFPFCNGVQGRWAEQIGVHFGVLNSYICLREWPHGKRGWFISALKIAEAVGELPEYIFDPVLYGERPQEIRLEVGRGIVPRLLDTPDPEENFIIDEEKRLIREAVGTLRKREQEVIRGRFGLDCEEVSVREVGNKMDITGSRVQQIEVRALRRLRHPSRSRMLRWGVPNVSPEDILKEKENTRLEKEEAQDIVDNTKIDAINKRFEKQDRKKRNRNRFPQIKLTEKQRHEIFKAKWSHEMRGSI